MRRARTWVVGIAIAIALAGGGADAAAPKPLAEALQGDAKTAYESARVLYGDGDYAGAIAKFQRAYDLSPDPRLLWNMAACEKQLRHYARVLRLVDRYLAEGGALLSTKDRKEATDFATAVRAFVAEVTIACNEPGAIVYVDDEKLGPAPLPAAVLVDQGSRRFRATKPDFKDGVKIEVLDGGTKRTITLELRRVIHEARLAVHASPGDTIVVDGQVVGHGDWSAKVTTGPHVVEVTAPGKKSRRYEQVLRDDESKSIDVALESEPTSTSWPWYVGGAAVAVGVVIGGYFLLRPSKGSSSPPTDGTLGSYQVP